MPRAPQVMARFSAEAAAQGPGIRGGFPAQFVYAGRRGRSGGGLDPPELQLGLPGFGPGPRGGPGLATTPG